MHLDTGDLGLMTAKRLYRDKSEHPWAYHFLYGTLSSTLHMQKVIIKQHTGTIGGSMHLSAATAPQLPLIEFNLGNQPGL